jgi:hypothetical protein
MLRKLMALWELKMLTVMLSVLWKLRLSLSELASGLPFGIGTRPNGPEELSSVVWK